MAEGLDAEQKSNAHGSALTAALTAVKEAEDFLPNGSRLEADTELSLVIAAHATPILKDHAENMTPMTAMRCYMTFAQEQFAGSAARWPVRWPCTPWANFTALAGKKGGLAPGAEAKAVVCYQAALIVYPKNYMAANDLGVLLARCGDYARPAMLEHSLSLSRQSATWHNLAVVYRQLGQPALARSSRPAGGHASAGRAARRQKTASGTTNSSVGIDPQAFAQTSANTPSSPGADSPPATGGASAEPGLASRRGAANVRDRRPQPSEVGIHIPCKLISGIVRP